MILFKRRFLHDSASRRDPLKTRFLLLAVCVQAHSAAASSFSILGETLQFDPPSGYCVSANSTPAEKELLVTTQQVLRGTSRVVAWMAPCTELQEFKSGAREYLDHWLQIQVLTPRGELKRVQASREQMLASLSNSAVTMDPATIERRSRLRLAEIGGKLHVGGAEFLGRDGNAVYLAISARLASTSGSERFIRGVGSITLINTVPLGVYSYEATRRPASIDAARTAMNSVLRTLLTQN